MSANTLKAIDSKIFWWEYGKPLWRSCPYLFPSEWTWLLTHQKRKHDVSQGPPLSETLQFEVLNEWTWSLLLGGSLMSCLHMNMNQWIEWMNEWTWMNEWMAWMAWMTWMSWNEMNVSMKEWMHELLNEWMTGISNLFFKVLIQFKFVSS